jgi:phage shock protein A
MGLFDRLGRVVRASLNALIDEAEDPEKVLEQTVAEMQAELINLRQSVAQVIATQKRTERQVALMRSQAQQIYSKAQLALQNGDEATAREALKQRQTHLEQAQTMAQQEQQQQQIVAQLKANMRTLERKIIDARTQKDLYIARARSAQASQRVQEMLGKVSNSAKLGTFDRMEEKILTMEAKAAALAELNTPSDPLEQKFAQLENPIPSIETELNRLKATLPPRKPHHHPHSPSP